MPIYHIAQVNIGRVKAPVEDPLMAGFVARLDEINALADRSPGFVWRLQTPVGNATYFRPYPEDDRILINIPYGRRLRHCVITFTRRRTRNFSAKGKHGLRSSQACIWPSGGCRRDTVPAWTKPPNALPILRSTAPRNLLSPSRRHLSPTTRFSRESIGHHSCLPGGVACRLIKCSAEAGPHFCRTKRGRNGAPANHE